MACYNSNGYVSEEDFAYLEPTDARRAFPCWDEPAVKATFEVEITADKALTVLSNMDVNSEKESGGKKVTLFNPTPKMSTYVLPLFWPC
jgi:aminopeptidase 2